MIRHINDILLALVFSAEDKTQRHFQIKGFVEKYGRLPTRKDRVIITVREMFCDRHDSFESPGIESKICGIELMEKKDTSS